MSATVKVVLHGRLAQFGGPFDWGVATPQAAIRALCVMRPGFRTEFAKGQYRMIRGTKNNRARLSLNMAGIKLAPGSEFHLVPAAAGSGGGAGKAILGVALVAVAFAAPEVAAAYGLGGGLAGTTIAGISAATVLKVGIFLTLDGVAQLLAPTHKSDPNEAATNESFALNPPSNSIEQGNPVPLVYGTVKVGSVQVSAGYSANEIAIGTAAPTGSPYAVNGWTGGFVPTI